MRRTVENRLIPLCACGCGEEVKSSWKRFLRGHNLKTIGSRVSHSIRMKNKNPMDNPMIVAKLKGDNHHMRRRKESRDVLSKRQLSLKENHPFRSEKYREKQSKRLSLQTGKNARSWKGGKIIVYCKNCGKSKKMFPSLINDNCFCDLKCRNEWWQGPNNPAWKGGIAAEPYCDVWLDREYKESIKERDGRTCQNSDCKCNTGDLPLVIHHIDYDKKNCHPWNLITLCFSCNSRGNFNRDYWQEVYNKIISEKYERKAA